MNRTNMQAHGPHPTRSARSRARLLRNARCGGDLETLRTLVVGPEQLRLDQVEQPSAERVGDVLPEAVAHAILSRPDELATTLAKPVTAALRSVARREPAFFGEILAPAIGTAVRRAVADVLAALMQRLDQILERGVSLRSWRWRIEARRTGRPFAEIVIARTLVYRVEWAVLIDSRTSLVLQEASSQDVARAPDQTAAMLQAINSFVSDALQSASPGGTLHAIEVGDVHLWIERSPRFTLALAIRGNPPTSLRDEARATLDRIETLHPATASTSDVTFDDTQPLLVACLKQQRRKPPKRARWIVGFVAASAIAIVVAVMMLGSSAHRSDVRLRAAYRESLSAEPGIVVTSVEARDDGHTIRGLRDPRAAHPAMILAAAGLPAATLELAPFESRDPRLPDPPDARDVMDELMRTVHTLDGIALEFRHGSAAIDDASSVQSAARLVRSADVAAATVGARLCVEIVGDTDDTGSEIRNRALREARATAVATSLEHAGVRSEVLVSRTAELVPPRMRARRVSFRVSLRPSATGGGCR
jgi:outer membrane protein OmpA-like peptidoglycan-associated protein